MANNIGNLVTKLIADTTGFDPALQGASRGLREYDNTVAKVSDRQQRMAGSSSRATRALLEFSRGAEDAAVVFGTQGLSGALRASSNNMSQMAAIINPAAGAVTGLAVAAGSILLPKLLEVNKEVRNFSDLADAISRVKFKFQIEDEKAKVGQKFADILEGINKQESAVKKLEMAQEAVLKLEKERLAIQREMTKNNQRGRVLGRDILLSLGENRGKAFEEIGKRLGVDAHAFRGDTRGVQRFRLDNPAARISQRLGIPEARIQEILKDVKPAELQSVGTNKTVDPKSLASARRLIGEALVRENLVGNELIAEIIPENSRKAFVDAVNKNVHDFDMLGARLEALAGNLPKARLTRALLEPAAGREAAKLGAETMVGLIDENLKEFMKTEAESKRQQRDTRNALGGRGGLLGVAGLGAGLGAITSQTPGPREDALRLRALNLRRALLPSTTSAADRLAGPNTAAIGAEGVFKTVASATRQQDESLNIDRQRLEIEKEIRDIQKRELAELNRQLGTAKVVTIP